MAHYLLDKLDIVRAFAESCTESVPQIMDGKVREKFRLTIFQFRLVQFFHSADHGASTLEHEVIVSDELASVSKSHIEIILQKMAQILMAQGISCFGCPLSRYKLYPLSGDCREDLLPRAREQSLMRFGLAVLCGNKQVATFELTLSPSVEN